MSVSELQTKVEWHRWRGWATDELEAWLEEKARQGWHLAKADRMMYRFHFEKGVPRPLRYCVDFQPSATKEYWKRFSDAGWELSAQGFGYYIWRTELADAPRPQFDADQDEVDPVIQRNQRLLLVLILMLVMQVPVQVPLWFSGAIERLLASPWGKAAAAVYGLMIVVMLWAIVAIARANVRLQAHRQ